MKKNILLTFLTVANGLLFGQQNQQASWQQEVAYFIEAKLMDGGHYLKAFERISYTNNSAQTLTYLYFHVWPNAYKNHSEPFAKQQLENGQTNFYFAEAQDHGMIDSLDFKIDGETVKWELLKDTGDVCKIYLNKPLTPGAKIEIATPFRTKFPKVFSRMGHEGQFYAATQWYPKPAVFDVNGWNYMPYLDQGEFYSEFGSFEVKLTLPANYVVAATGELQEEREKQWLDSLAEIKNSRITVVKEDVINEKTKIIDPKLLLKVFPPSSPQWKTITFKQNNVHDFAWFADKRFNVAKSKVKLTSGRVITTWAYSVKSKPTDGVEYVNKSVAFYSKEVGEYPYNICSAVDGPLVAGGGMEYPTITICSGLNEQVVVHEVGHNWFYGILGSQERLHPWMDEGINSFYEKDYYAGKKMVPQSPLQRMFDLSSFERNYESEVLYLFSARKGEDQPIELPAYAYTSTNYAAIVYSKTPLAFRYLRGYLGKELFDSCMHTYYSEWQFKHPLPGDIQRVFERVSNKKLDWFFNGMIRGTGKVDYQMQHATSANGTTELKIKNKGSLVTPFSISAVTDSAVSNTQWFEGFKGTKKITFKGETGRHLELDALRQMPELYRKNNYIKSSGWFKRCAPLRIQLFGSLEHPYKKQLFVSPTFGWNAHNKWMIGAAFYNTIFPSKKLEYQFIPLFSPATGDVNGYAGIQRYWHSINGIIQTTEIGYNMVRFRTVDFGEQQQQSYMKQNPYMNFVIRKTSPRSAVKRSFKLQYTSILEHNENGKAMYYDLAYFSSRFIKAGFTWEKSKKINPALLAVNMEQGKDYYVRFVKATADFRAKFNIGMPKKNLDVRLFAGVMDFARQTGSLSGRYYLQMTSTTYRDYTMDYAVLGRGLENGWLGQQVLEREGGFKVATAASSDKWLLSANFKCDLPGVLPIKLYADFGTYAQMKTINPNSDWIIYNAGVLFSIFNGSLEIYLPALSSNDIKTLWANNSTSYGRYIQRISFNLKLNQLNPFHIARNIRF
jgi:hypothetical protein